MLLFHGTLDRYAENIMQHGILLNKSKPFLDFGPGFYTTPEKEFAEYTAKYRAARNNAYSKNKFARGAIVVFEYSEDSNLEILNFDRPCIEWAIFTYNNRREDKKLFATPQEFNNQNFRYDLVKGPTADGKAGIFTSLNETDTVPVIDNAFIRRIYPSENYGVQYSFHTHKSLACLSTKEYAIL